MSPVGPQFKEVKPLVGAFVLGALCIALALVFATARAQRWFERVTPLLLVLPEDGSYGLRRGSGVELLGSAVGSVDDIWIDDRTDRMQARLLVRTEFLRFVRSDSRFVIKRRTLGLTGDAYIEITRGSQTPATANTTFIAVPDSEPTQLLQDLSTELLPTIRAAREVIENHGTLAQKLTDPQGSLLQSLQRIDRLLETIERGDGVVGHLLHDEAWSGRLEKVLQSAETTLDGARTAVAELTAAAKALADDAHGPIERANALLESAWSSTRQLPEILEDARRALASAQEALDHLVAATGALPEVAGVMRTEARGLTGVVAQARLTMAEMERLIVALQDHWLLRGYVPDLPATPRLAPSELGSGK
ncbi:MAG: MlaD family protein [Planctomycetota bacterium]